MLYIHVVGCIFWFTIVQNETWVPAADFIYAETKLFRETFTKKYLSMLYHAIMIFGVNEVAPVEESELYVTIILMTISAMLNAVIFGEMAVLVQEMDKKDIDQQEYLDNANTAMFSLEIPENIQDEVRQFLIEV
jgi:hypothetical protein